MGIVERDMDISEDDLDAGMQTEVPYDGVRYEQVPRLQVRLSPITKDKIRSVFTEKRGAKRIVTEAETLDLLEIFRLLSAEERVPKTLATIAVTPTEALLRKAASFYLGPHLLVRAAAVKMAERIEQERQLKLYGPSRQTSQGSG